MNQEAADEAKAYLPEQTEFVSIAGETMADSVVMVIKR